VISGQSDETKESPWLQVWSNWVSSGGETAATLTPELSTLTMNAFSIPPARSGSGVDPKPDVRVQYAEEDRMGMW